MAKKISKQGELALAIMDKCKKLGCEGPDDTAELIAGASLIILKNIGDYLCIPFEEMKKEYIKGLLEAVFISKETN